MLKVGFRSPLKFIHVLASWFFAENVLASWLFLYYFYFIFCVWVFWL